MAVKAADREGRRHHIGFRATAEAKARLEEAASRAGRSLTQEIEFRLEQSLERDELFEPNSRALGEVVTASAIHYQASAGLIWAVDVEFARYVHGRLVGDLARVMRVEAAEEIDDIAERTRAKQIEEWARSDDEMEGQRSDRWKLADRETVLRKLATVRRWPPPLSEGVGFMDDQHRTRSLGPFKTDDSAS